jgi:hypothetical protein
VNKWMGVTRLRGEEVSCQAAYLSYCPIILLISVSFFSILSYEPVFPSTQSH